MQVKDENILTSSDKLNGFLRKIDLWKLHIEKKTTNVSVNIRYRSRWRSNI